MIRRLSPDRAAFGRCLAGLVLAMALSGCAGTAEQPTRAPRQDTLELPDLLCRVNSNAQALPSLRAQVYYELMAPDSEGRGRFVNGDGTLMYRRPGDFRLIGRKDVAGVVFDVGCNAERVWLNIAADGNTTWLGRRDGPPRSVGAGGMPLDPDLLLQVLGVAAHGSDLLTPPWPVLRFNGDVDAYMLLWARPDGDRIVVEKEIWYDATTLSPVLVVLYDRRGRVALRAYLSDPVRVPVRGREERNWPTVASKYRLFVPGNGAKMRLELSEPVLSLRGVPNDFSFEFQAPAGSRVIDLDHAPN